MKTSRRSVLGSVPALGLMSAVGMPRVFSEMSVALEQGAGNQPDSQNQVNDEFWNEGIRNAESGSARSISPNRAPQAVFVYFDNNRGFVTGSDIGDVALADR